MNHTCPLCGGNATLFYQKKGRTFLQCNTCCGLFVPETDRPDAAGEYARYRQHENRPDDPGYQQFVSPLVERIAQDFSPAASGLDYGAGPGPVAAILLRKRGYDIALYDPFFHPDKNVLEQYYDFILCSEVVEHFHHPEKEFQRLHRMLKPGGRLYCMTAMYHPGIDFSGWQYKNDPTHVFIYGQGTFAMIQQNMHFANLEIEGKIAVLTKAF